MINVQLDARRGGDRRPAATLGFRSLTIQAVRIAGTFTTIVLLWSLWSSPSVSAWIDLLRRGLKA
jgi:hypothetical protein